MRLRPASCPETPHHLRLHNRKGFPYSSGKTFRLSQSRASTRCRPPTGRDSMQYRTLGRTGIQVSPYALGTLMFATSMGNAPEDSARIIHKSLDGGINFVDTADAYGDSEDVVGKALEGRRDDVVLA